MGRTAKKRIIKILVLAGLLIGAIYVAFPVLWMLGSSFKPNSEMFASDPTILPKEFTFSAYRSIFSSPEKLRFFFNSYVVATVVTIATLVVAILAGYGFSRFEFRIKKPLNLFIISTQAVPQISVLIPYFGIIVVLGLYNTYWALILTYMIFTLPYAILMMTGYFNTLPKELDEAVLVDGGKRSRILWQVLVPISLPGIVSTGMYTFLQAWNEYLFALTLTKTIDMRTVPIGIQQLMGQQSYEWNEMMAMSVLGCLPVLLLVLFFQRYFIAGMTAGSVKQ